MKKSAQPLFCIAVTIVIVLSGISAFAGNVNLPGQAERYLPVISDKIKQKAASGEEVAVLIKLKEEWERPSIKKMTTAADPDHFISKQDIKRLQKKVLMMAFSPEERKNDIKVGHQLENIPWITGRINQKALEKLKDNPNIAIIIEDIMMNAQLAESGPLMSSDAAHTAGNVGTGVTVAVIDSGIDTDHPDLDNDLLWEECFLYHGCPGDESFGGSRASGPGSAEDGLGHGTHVSGIITSGNTTYMGVAPEAKIVAIKVLDDSGNGFIADTIAGLDWVVSNRDTYDIRVVNLSLGSSSTYSGNCDSFYPASAAAADAVKAAGIVLFASSGNAANTAGMGEPACLSSTISVGAVYDADVHAAFWSACTDTQTDADQIACFSNVSPELDILAPGAKIDSSGLVGGISNMSGTSMSSPHAAGLAALMVQKNPFLSPDEIENILKSTGIPTYDSRVDVIYPRIDAVGALNSTPDANPTLTLTASGSGSGTMSGAGTYNYGEVATVTATADSGSVFEWWSGPDAAECTSGSVDMTTDKSCTATFTIDNCPSDPLKIEPGYCGCGVADADTDGDGTLDCNDLDVLGERGSGLSQGQRQLLSIARAAL
ncbi:S8 family serine peptidase, partial [Malonomonas rubra]|uniref:S8 family serine peptidase n=1 Tax=Malonomonas rubra TaxID=57040 RepID=UPI0026E9751F